MGGHIDSWDTGSQTGANDDGGGFITCFEAMRLLLKNNLRPKRTIRFIAWSGE
jgi:carboxypeptidase Q